MTAAVIFDFDGTLFDAGEAICRSFNGALAATERAPVPDAVIRAWIGRPLREMFAAEDPGADAAMIERRIDEYRRIFLPICAELSRPMPGALECLETLRRRGLRLAIVTNRKGDGLRAILRAFGLEDRFQALIGLEDVRRAKPDPEPVLEALRRLGAMPERAVMVGDTPEDMCAAVAAGVRAIGAATGAHDAAALYAAGADDVLATLADLPALITRIGIATEKSRR